MRKSSRQHFVLAALLTYIPKITQSQTRSPPSSSTEHGAEARAWPILPDGYHLGKGTRSATR